MTHRRRKILLGVSIVIVALLAAGGAYLFAQLNKPATDTSSSQQATTQAEQVASDADKQAFEGSVKSGVKTYDEAIANTTDTNALFTLYSKKATLLYNDTQYGAAIEAAKKAFDLNKTSSSAAFVGQIAADKGDTATALEYYKKAISLIDETAPLASEDKDYYSGVVKDLEAQQ